MRDRTEISEVASRERVRARLAVATLLGAVVGGLIGAFAVSLEVGRAVALNVSAVGLVVLVVATARWRLTGAEESERSDEGLDQGGLSGPRLGIRQALRKAPFLLVTFGLIAAMAGAVEDSAASWAAIHMRESLGAGPFVAGLGFVAAQAMMVIGRTTGDRLVDRYSARSVARIGSLVAFVGMSGVVLGGHPAIVIVGFGLAASGWRLTFRSVLQRRATSPGCEAPMGSPWPPGWHGSASSWCRP